MVAAGNVVVDECGFQGWRELGRGAEVIDTPADIPLPRPVLVAPPGVASPALFEVTEGVHIARRQCAVEGLPLLDREAGVLRVVLRTRQVDLAVGHIHVAAKDDGFGFFECREVVDECGSPFSRAVVQSSQLTLGIGRVNIHQEKIPHVGADDAPFLVMFLTAYAVDDALGLLAGENCRAGVAGFDGGIPEDLVSIECLRHLFLTRFDFLQADHIRLFSLQIIHEPLAEDRANAVHIP